MESSETIQETIYEVMVMVSCIFVNFVDTQLFCRMSSKNMETAAGFQDDATSCEIYSYGLGKPSK